MRKSIVCLKTKLEIYLLWLPFLSFSLSLFLSLSPPPLSFGLTNNTASEASYFRRVPKKKEKAILPQKLLQTGHQSFFSFLSLDLKAKLSHWRNSGSVLLVRHWMNDERRSNNKQKKASSVFPHSCFPHPKFPPTQRVMNLCRKGKAISLRLDSNRGTLASQKKGEPASQCSQRTLSFILIVVFKFIIDFLTSKRLIDLKEEIA